MNRLWLVKNGVPYQLAIEMNETEVEAHAIGFGIISGGDFDFDRWEFKKSE